jgi:hypothetical protein
MLQLQYSLSPFVALIWIKSRGSHSSDKIFFRKSAVVCSTGYGILYSFILFHFENYGIFVIYFVPSRYILTLQLSGQLTAIFWIFRSVIQEVTNISEECTASIFGISEQDGTCKWSLINLICVPEDRQYILWSVSELSELHGNLSWQLVFLITTVVRTSDPCHFHFKSSSIDHRIIPCF